MLRGSGVEARFEAGTLALDFVNSTTGHSSHGPRRWEDSLTDAFATLTWLRRREAVDEEGFRALMRVAASDEAAAEAFMRDVRRLRAVLGRLFQAAITGSEPPADDIEAFNAFVAAAHASERLVWRPGGLARAAAKAQTDLARALWPIVTAAEELLTSERIARVKLCGSHGCDWLFLDTTKNNSRRWCRMDVCGNREKGRRRLQRERAA